MLLSHLVHDVVVQFRLRLSPVDGQRQTPQLYSGGDEAAPRHRRVPVALELDEREATVARFVAHVRVHDDVPHSVDASLHLGEDLGALALSRQTSDEQAIVVD